MNPAKTVVYMADDDEDDRYFMRKSLQQIDPSITIVEAEDGSQLLTLLNNWSQTSANAPVHLILLDMNMPGMNGLDTLMAIKANPLLRHIPTVIVSTSAEPVEMATAYQYGINGYIKKSSSSLHRDEIARALNVCFMGTGTD